MLSTPLSEARVAAEHPNGPEVWAGLLQELAAELCQMESAESRPVGEHGDTGFSAELDDIGVP